MLILSIVFMIPGYVKSVDILNRIKNEKSNPNWESTGPTAEDIRAGNEQADKAERLFARREFGSQLKSAVEKNDLKNVKILIAAGADLEVTDNWGMTALMVAAQKGYTDIVKELINAGANVDAKGACDSTALLYAIEKGDVEIVKLLIGKAENSCDLTTLNAAINKRNIKIVKLLVTKGVATKDPIGFEGSFVIAVCKGDNEMVEALIGGADSIHHAQLKRALMYSRTVCSAEIVNAIEELLKKSQS